MDHVQDKSGKPVSQIVKGLKRGDCVLMRVAYCDEVPRQSDAVRLEYQTIRSMRYHAGTLKGAPSSPGAHRGRQSPDLNKPIGEAPGIINMNRFSPFAFTLIGNLQEEGAMRTSNLPLVLSARPRYDQALRPRGQLTLAQARELCPPTERFTKNTLVDDGPEQIQEKWEEWAENHNNVKNQRCTKRKAVDDAPDAPAKEVCDNVDETELPAEQADDPAEQADANMQAGAGDDATQDGHSAKRAKHTGQDKSMNPRQ